MIVADELQAMNPAKTHDFEHVTVALPAIRARSSQVVWYDEALLAKATSDRWSPERFLHELHVATLGGNPLPGQGTNQILCHGVLSLAEGIAELVNSIVLGQILPRGTVSCYGLIHTGGDATDTRPALNGGSVNGVPGALLVRAACVCPAHFLRHASFDHDLRAIRKDVRRTRRMNKELHDRLQDRNDFTREIEQFLAACADQFGFGRVFRLRHGRLSPSSLSFDGRWLEVASAGFVDSGKSYAASTSAVPSQEEPMAVLSLLEELSYTFAKYTGTVVDTRPLLDCYIEQLAVRSRQHCARVVGLPPGAFASAKGVENAVEQLSSALLNRIIGESTLSLGGPSEFSDRDPIVVLIEDLFRHLQPETKPRLANGNFQALLAVPAFTQLINRSYEERPDATLTKAAFTIGCAIRSLRKLYFSSFYYDHGRHALGAQVAALDNPADGGQLIDEFCDVSRWLFDDADRGEDVLFESRRLKISYNGRDGAFIAHRRAAGETLHFTRAGELREAMSRFSDRELRICHGEFRRGLLRMIDVLSFLDRPQR